MENRLAGGKSGSLKIVRKLLKSPRREIKEAHSDLGRQVRA